MLETSGRAAWRRGKTKLDPEDKLEEKSMQEGRSTP